MKSSLQSPQLEKSQKSNEDPTHPKINFLKKFNVTLLKKKGTTAKLRLFRFLYLTYTFPKSKQNELDILSEKLTVCVTNDKIRTFKQKFEFWKTASQ